MPAADDLPLLKPLQSTRLRAMLPRNPPGAIMRNREKGQKRTKDDAGLSAESLAAQGGGGRETKRRNDEKITGRASVAQETPAPIASCEIQLKRGEIVNLTSAKQDQTNIVLDLTLGL